MPKTGRTAGLFAFIQVSSKKTIKNPVTMKDRNKTKVMADPAGNVIRPSKNPEWGFIRVVQIRTVYDEFGFMKRRSVSALIHGLIEDLKAEKYYANQELSGHIVIREQLTPFDRKNPDLHKKVAGETNVPCTFEGQPIYSKNFYVEDSEAEDILIQHDNKEELREAFKALKNSEEKL